MEMAVSWDHDFHARFFMPGSVGGSTERQYRAKRQQAPKEMTCFELSP